MGPEAPAAAEAGISCSGGDEEDVVVLIAAYKYTEKGVRAR